MHALVRSERTYQQVMNNRCEFIRYHLFSHEQLQGFPLAGKSGTSSDFRDAWLVGYTPELVTGVWVGYDDHRPLGEKETGGRTALPLWLAFMREASRDSETGDFPVPTGIEWSVVNLKANGYPLPLFERSLETNIPFASGTRVTALKLETESEP